MAKISKKRKAAEALVDKDKQYTLSEAAELINKINCTSFDSAVDLHVRQGVNPRKADQNVRGSVTLPHGTGKSKKVLVLCTPDKEEEAKEAGADFVGLDEYIEKIQGGWTDVDVVVATPSVMPKIGRLGKILGPRNLMPNPKTGTVTMDVAKAVNDVKGGKISFKVDKAGIIHTSVGRVSFSAEKLTENARELLQTIIRLKPATAKGIYLKGISMATTMSPGVSVDAKSVTN